MLSVFYIYLDREKQWQPDNCHCYCGNVILPCLNTAIFSSLYYCWFSLQYLFAKLSRPDPWYAILWMNDWFITDCWSHGNIWLYCCYNVNEPLAGLAEQVLLALQYRGVHRAFQNGWLRPWNFFCLITPKMITRCHMSFIFLWLSCSFTFFRRTR